MKAEKKTCFGLRHLIYIYALYDLRSYAKNLCSTYDGIAGFIRPTISILFLNIKSAWWLCSVHTTSMRHSRSSDVVLCRYTSQFACRAIQRHL